MIAKELRDARWKLVLAAIPVLFMSYYLPGSFSESVEIVQGTADDATDIALRDISDIYVLGGFIILIPLAAFIGVTAFSVEVGNGSILTLLSGSVSRTRILLTKYTIGAGILLSVAVAGKVLLLSLAALRGNPVREISLSDTVLSTLLMWIGLLSVLSIALLISTLIRNVVASIGICAIVLSAYLGWAGIYAQFSVRGYYQAELSPTSYWISSNYFLNNTAGIYDGGGFELTSFAFCIVTAAIPLLVALIVFNRKAF